MTPEIFNQYVQQNVPKDVQEFLYIEVNNGVPSDEIMYTFVMNPRIKEKVMTLYKAKQARTMKLAKLRDLKSNQIIESSESQEQSS